MPKNAFFDCFFFQKFACGAEKFAKIGAKQCSRENPRSAPVTDPKTFLRASLAPIYTNFEGRAEKTQFFGQNFPKILPKKAFAQNLVETGSS